MRTIKDDVLEALGTGPSTVADLAAALGMKPARAYKAINTLLEQEFAAEAGDVAGKQGHIRTIFRITEEGLQYLKDLAAEGEASSAAPSPAPDIRPKPPFVPLEWRQLPETIPETPELPAFSRAATLQLLANEIAAAKTQKTVEIDVDRGSLLTASVVYLFRKPIRLTYEARHEGEGEAQ